MHDIVTAVLVEDRRVLLTHRSPTRDAYPNVWDLPGGHIEAGESTTQAIARELHEELAITVDQAHVEILTPQLIATRDVRLSVCRIHDWQGEPLNACPAEHDQIGWFTLGDLANLDFAHPALTDLLSIVLDDEVDLMTEIDDVLLGVLDDIEPLMQAAFDAVGGSPEPGSALDQVFLLDGREVVAGYLQHGEPGLALDHLAYMIREPGLDISSDTRRHLLAAGRMLGNPPGIWSDVAHE